MSLPHGGGERADLGLGEQLCLELLAAPAVLLRGLEILSKLLQTGFQLLAQGMIGLRRHGVQYLLGPVQEALDQTVLDGPGQPPGRVHAQSLVELRPVLAQVAAQAPNPDLDEGVVSTLPGELGEGAACQRGQGYPVELLAHQRVEHAVHVVVA